MISPFGEVLVLTHRCCGPVLGQADANILYLSDDGGATFDTGHPIGTVEPGEPSAPQSALLDGAGRQVVTINGPTEGPSLQAQPIAPFGGGATPFTPDGQKARLANEYGYDPSVVQPDRHDLRRRLVEPRRDADDDPHAEAARPTHARPATSTTSRTGARRSPSPTPSCRA